MASETRTATRIVAWYAAEDPDGSSSAGGDAGEARCPLVGRILPDLRAKLPRGRDETTRSSFCRKGARHRPFPGQKLVPVILGTLRTTLGRLGISEPVDTQILFLSENF